MRSPILIIFSMLMLMFLSSCSSGTGLDSPSDADPAIGIYTSDQLLAMAEDKDNYDKRYVLTDNITLTGSWTPIGDYDVPFTGTFDGNGHTISGININDTSADCQGLFGYLSKTAIVKNLGVLEVDITGHDFAGGIAGCNYGDISASYSTGKVVASNDYAGGVAGWNNIGAKISASYSTAAITAGFGAGGIAGYNSGDISASYSKGDITASSQYAGGIAGRNVGDISVSYSTGDIAAADDAGGIAGINLRGISDSYSAGDITANNDNAGGIAGINYGGISASYSTGDITANNDNAGGIAGYNCIASSISGCAALNKTITISTGAINAGSIAGYNEFAGVLSGNYAFGGMFVNGATVIGSLNYKNGANVTKDDVEMDAFWRETLGFDETVWDLEFSRGYMLPLLKEIDAANQPDKLPNHLQ